ncbi:MAG TPA: nuclear transport factor 2 family protein [Burkholderiales bacterium]|nr:nuclear transport factor 2 family protein [Burkholderiales bacterium]
MERLYGLAAGMAMLGAVAAAPAMAAQGCSGKVTEAEVLAAEDARYAAQTGDDYGALDKLLGEDLVYTHSSAVVDNKASYVDSMKSGTVKYRVMRRSDVKVRTYDCVAIITGQGNFDVTVKGQDIAVELRFTSVWAKRPGGLQFISWESTRMPQKQ